jgi:hypothetical protein
MLAFISEGRACQCYCPIRRQRVWIEKQSCLPVGCIAGEHHILVLQSRVLEVVPSLCMSRQNSKVSAGVATSFQRALLAGVEGGPHTHRMQFSEPLVGIATLKLIMCTSSRASAVERGMDVKPLRLSIFQSMLLLAVLCTLNIQSNMQL